MKYQLSINNFGHCLHGVNKGFQNVVYDASLIDNNSLELREDELQGFSGNISCLVLFTLTDDNAINIKYEVIYYGFQKDFK